MNNWNNFFLNKWNTNFSVAQRESGSVPGNDPAGQMVQGGPDKPGNTRDRHWDFSRTKNAFSMLVPARSTQGSSDWRKVSSLKIIKKVYAWKKI